MEMNQIWYFLVAADELNFTRASERCGISQPTMTRAIQSLEADVGAPLFLRERKNVVLSELGRMMQPYFEQIWKQRHEAKELARKHQAQKGTLLRLGIMCTIAPHRILPLVQNAARGPMEIDLHVADGNASEICAMLQDDKIDAGFLAMPDAFPEALYKIPLYREQFMIAVSRAHELAKASSVRVKDLKGQNYLFRADCEYDAYAGEIFRQSAVACRQVCKCDRDDWILAMAAAGLGFSFIPSDSAYGDGIVVRPLVEPEIWREVHLVTVRGRRHNGAVGHLVRLARRQFLMQDA